MLKRIFVLLSLLVLVVGCTPDNSYNTNLERLPKVVTGRAAWGPVNLRLESADVVAGRTGWGKNSITHAGDRYSGRGAWGTIDVQYSNGHLTGRLPWGKIDVTVTATTVDGRGPWGPVHLKLDGQSLTGRTAWGPATLVLDDNYHSLTEPAVISAILAVIADEGSTN